MKSVGLDEQELDLSLFDGKCFNSHLVVSNGRAQDIGPGGNGPAVAENSSDPHGPAAISSGVPMPSSLESLRATTASKSQSDGRDCHANVSLSLEANNKFRQASIELHCERNSQDGNSNRYEKCDCAQIHGAALSVPTVLAVSTASDKPKKSTMIRRQSSLANFSSSLGAESPHQSSFDLISGDISAIGDHSSAEIVEGTGDLKNPVLAIETIAVPTVLAKQAAHAVGRGSSLADLSSSLGPDSLERNTFRLSESLNSFDIRAVGENELNILYDSEGGARIKESRHDMPADTSKHSAPGNYKMAQSCNDSIPSIDFEGGFIQEHCSFPDDAEELIESMDHGLWTNQMEQVPYQMKIETLTGDHTTKVHVHEWNKNFNDALHDVPGKPDSLFPDAESIQQQRQEYSFNSLSVNPTPISRVVAKKHEAFKKMEEALSINHDKLRALKSCQNASLNDPPHPIDCSPSFNISVPISDQSNYGTHPITGVPIRCDLPIHSLDENCLPISRQIGYPMTMDASPNSIEHVGQPADSSITLNHIPSADNILQEGPKPEHQFHENYSSNANYIATSGIDSSSSTPEISNSRCFEKIPHGAATQNIIVNDCCTPNNSSWSGTKPRENNSSPSKESDEAKSRASRKRKPKKDLLEDISMGFFSGQKVDLDLFSCDPDKYVIRNRKQKPKEDYLKDISMGFFSGTKIHNNEIIENSEDEKVSSSSKQRNIKSHFQNSPIRGPSPEKQNHPGRRNVLKPFYNWAPVRDEKTRLFIEYASPVALPVISITAKFSPYAVAYCWFVPFFHTLAVALTDFGFCSKFAKYRFRYAPISPMGHIIIDNLIAFPMVFSMLIWPHHFGPHVRGLMLFVLCWEYAHWAYSYKDLILRQDERQQIGNKSLNASTL